MIDPVCPKDGHCLARVNDVRTNRCVLLVSVLMLGFIGVSD